MVIIKATPNSEAGIMPSEQLLSDMGNFNKYPCQSRYFRHELLLHMVLKQVCCCIVITVAVKAAERAYYSQQMQCVVRFSLYSLYCTRTDRTVYAVLQHKFTTT
jgi:hypothetical protein